MNDDFVTATESDRSPTGQPLLRVSPKDLDSLLGTLEVSFVALSECLVSPGYSLELGGVNAAGIHYNLAGVGRAYIGKDPPIQLAPHTLIVVPKNCPFRIEVDGGTKRRTVKSIDARVQTTSNDGLRKFVAGEGPPEVVLICGFFNATYGSSVDLFGALTTPIVEQFSEADELDHKLKVAVAELIAQEVGTGTMTAALLKQVIVVLLRRSLSSLNLWVERFSMLSDPRIARAFSEMVAHPGAPHTIHSLAQTACLSRSAFMSRFAELVGRSPMVVLRDVRMRQAVQQLKGSDLSLDQVAQNAGYASRSSFLRAYRKAHGSDPSKIRTKTKPVA